MDLQTWLAAALVAGCAVWSVWLLAPPRARQALRRRLGRASAAGPHNGDGGDGDCSGCAGCGGDRRPPPAAAQPVVIVRRPRA